MRDLEDDIKLWKTRHDDSRHAVVLMKRARDAHVPVLSACPLAGCLPSAALHGTLVELTCRPFAFHRLLEEANALQRALAEHEDSTSSAAARVRFAPGRPSPAAGADSNSSFVLSFQICLPPGSEGVPVLAQRVPRCPCWLAATGASFSVLTPGRPRADRLS